ncbi:MAG TPA: class I tRNA ligase family protein [Candidatus Saccharimonadales bacterium]|nr:class I tRNA ligase family protein [Candidatus Saccharimonadales bacterium]
MTDKKQITNNTEQKIEGKIVPRFVPTEIEPKWQKVWEENKTYEPDLDHAKKPFYNLMMFPYPSAEGLHVGNVYAQTGSDIQGRFQRMLGNDVFQPFGLDGFGIHSENYALKVGRTPQEHARISEKNFYRQVHTTGSGMAWDEKLETYDPSYYKWTQWLFLELFKAGLAYRKKAAVNYCPSCKTVLSDEQVIDDKCERCGTIVEKRNLEQWFFRITSYSERLLNNIKKLDWSDKVKVAQTNWIGKKEGIEITYNIENTSEKVTVFTTRPDTNFGATFIALAPEHPLLEKITTTEHQKEVSQYQKMTQSKTEQERVAEGKEKTGVFTGSYAVNPLTGYKMAIWVSDFVLMSFGTGALVGVPGHDMRDFEFAQEFGLEIKRVVVGKDGDISSITHSQQVQEEEGTMVNSDFLNGLDIHAATEKMMDYIEEKGWGKRVATYHLRDWLISRQRYWGPPIPMIYCEACAQRGIVFGQNELGEERGDVILGEAKRPIEPRNDPIASLPDDKDMAGWFPVPESELPVLLPETEHWKPTGTGESPLAQMPEFYQTTCPNCGGPARRETDVSDTFLDSSWYFFRYTSVDTESVAFDTERVKKWLPVTLYTGGAEHSVLHLLYSRFITMVLCDLGYISFDEPFATFRAHGLIIKDGAKMSKSKGNVVVPDEYIQKFGADTLRAYLMFLGPFSQGGDFSDSGIEGMYRFLRRIWVMVQEYLQSDDEGEMSKERVFWLNKTVKKVTEEMTELRYNTALAALMEWYNVIGKETLTKEEVEVYLKLLAPIAPHMTEELWQLLRLNMQEEHDVEFASIHKASWPTYDESLAVSTEVVVAIQVNGKSRDTISLSVQDASKQEVVEQKAQESASVKNQLSGKTVKKIIFVPGKILNFVAI